MPKITQHGSLFRDWESLIGAFDHNPDLLISVETIKGELEASLAQARALKVEQENLTGLRKAVSQRLLQTLAVGREAVHKLRSYVITRLGPRSERLTQFGITPIRSRSVSRTSVTAPGGATTVPTPAPDPPEPEITTTTPAKGGA
jgi:hypothetical protein